jgi:hypothetical protein
MHMLKAIFALFLLSVAQLLCKAQDGKTYSVYTGKNFYQQIPTSEIYLYQTFSPGKVVLRDGNEYDALLNYNTVAAEIEFLSENADTAMLIDKFDIKLITIGTDTFYYDNRFVKLLGKNGRWKYAMDNRFVVVKKRGVVENGIFYGNAGLGRTLSDWEQPRALSQWVVIEKKQLYFIGDRFNKFTLLDEKSLMTLFPAHASAINNFLRKNDLKLNNERQVVALLTFLNSLEK